jgi:hypothetical protein
MKKIAGSLLFALVLIPVLLAGCGKKEGGGGLEAAIVDSADFFCRVDYKSMKGAPMADYLEDLDGKVNPDDGEKDLLEKLEEVTSIEEANIVGMLVSGSLVGMDFDAENPFESAEDLDIAMSLTLDTSLSEDRFESGLQLLVDESGKVDLHSEKKGDRTIFSVVPRKPGEPTVFSALAGDGKAVYAAFSEKSLAATLAREETGGNLSSELQAADKILPAGSQVRYAFIMPSVLRDKVAAKIAEMETGAAENPTLGMLYGFIKPFRNLAAVSLGVSFSEKMDVNLFTDLGTDEDALQAATLIQTMAVPFITAQLAKSGGGAMTDYADRLTVGNDGSNLSLALSLSESDLAGLQPAKN